MFLEEIESMANISKKKVDTMKTKPLGYFLMSMLAGIYVGIGIILIFSVGGLLNAGGFSGTRIVMGVSFGIALSLVVFAGSELFTGNNLIMSAGISKGKVSVFDTVKLWIFCWIGNLVGSVLLALMYVQTGLAIGEVGEFIAKTSVAKTSIPANELFFRAVLCNILVCLAVWCSNKMKSESGKLIMIFWCLFAFITSGFEHSIANMTLIAIGVLNPMGEAVRIGGYFYNLFFVTLGNMVGGIAFVAIPYIIAASQKTNK
ncbi:formate/nitrite transporter family protein [Anaerotignum sp. MB30-C6]|uniref:formate/nitrite transporter family protein n=1 Tax=Anaerotignum sp. MB30-C6 TaxID=3070814 RepID=UPI0027DB0191|nr:formate/nitrite transporter family protein [Anaerotignum sp. MB30-C6]WMI80566.1 formate/nitrite transporter family protein [Anaerotignum sp. MB30-C6]